MSIVWRIVKKNKKFNYVEEFCLKIGNFDNKLTGFRKKLRIEGELTFTRALGDANYKPALSSEPDIYELNLSSDIEFIILSTDGFWNVRLCFLLLYFSRQFLLKRLNKAAENLLINFSKQDI